MSFKEDCIKATEFIESCYDENNTNDDLTFDERLLSRLNNLDDENVKEIVLNVMK